MKKKNTFIRVLALSLCAIVICLSLASCTGSDKVKSGFGEIWEGTKEGAQDIYNKVTDDSTGDVDMQFNNSEYISLCSSEVATLSTDSGEIVAHKIVATVTPSFALDKSVDWDIYWITKPEGAEDDVTYYADIAGEASDADSVAWLSLYHFAFGAEIGVRATTRVGGYSAECVIKLLGVPTSAEFDWAIYRRDSASDDDTLFRHGYFDADGLMDECWYLDNYDTIKVYFDFKCDNNPDGRVVGSQYNDYSFTFDGVDGEAHFYVVGSAGNTWTTCTKDRNPELFEKISERMQRGIDEGVNLTQGYLNVMPGWFVPVYGTSYKVETTQDGGATYFESTYLYDAGCDISGLRFNFTVTENVSGVSFSIALRFDNAPVEPTSVSLDTTEIVY